MARPFSLVQLFCLIALFLAFSATAQEQPYSQEEPVFVSSPYRSPLERETDFDMVSYTWALRLGIGYSISFINFTYDTDDLDVDILSESCDNGYDNFAMNFEVKFELPHPFHRFAFGVAMDYNMFSLDKVSLKTLDSADVIANISKDDVARFHVLSFIGFLEYRHPIPMGRTWISPYARFGIGVNINNSTKENTLYVQKSTLALMAAIGVEYHLSQQTSVFFEPRWHYNNANFVLRPDNTNKFTGEVDLSNLSFLIGVNFYFGHGKAL